MHANAFDALAALDVENELNALKIPTRAPDKFLADFAAKAALPSSERKLDLETISIEHYDLTLIFGTPEYEDGHKAFRVSRSTVRLVSDVWSEMLVGRWADASQAEIRLPDDSCKAGEIVMRIAHWQISLLPSTVPFVDFRELVMLTDKYNIGQAVRLAVASKKWLAPHKAAWRAWFHCTELQDFALMALVFGDESGFEFIAQRLAVEIECKTDDGTDTWWNGKEGSKVELESSLPDRILHIIHGVRNKILQDWTGHLGDALTDALSAEHDGHTSCKKELCSVPTIGILAKGLYAAHLCPTPSDASEMKHSVM